MSKIAKEPIEGAKGGEGKTLHAIYSTLESIEGKIKFAKTIDIEKGASIGVHKHINDIEIYYVVEGKGELHDNHETIEVRDGDINIVFEGENHGIKNIGQGHLKLFAICLERNK